MPETLRWALGVLACYRLVQFFGLDDGPWDVIQILRERLGAYRLGPQLIPLTWWGYLLRCPYCLGLYLAPLVTALCIWPTLPGDFVLGSLALAGGQALLHGKRGGWLGDKMGTGAEAKERPKFRLKADGTVSEE